MKKDKLGSLLYFLLVLKILSAPTWQKNKKTKTKEKQRSGIKNIFLKQK